MTIKAGIETIIKGTMRGDPRIIVARAAFALIVTIVSALLDDDDES